MSNTTTAEKTRGRKSKTSTQIAADNKQAAAGCEGKSEQGEMVRLHELEGFVVIALPAELREVLGEENYHQSIGDLNTYELTAILRAPGRIASVELPTYVGEIRMTKQGEFKLTIPTAPLQPTTTTTTTTREGSADERQTVVAALEKTYGPATDAGK